MNAASAGEARTRVIEKEAGQRRTPIFEHPGQRAGPEQRGNLVLDQVRKAHAGQGSIDDKALVIEHQRPVHAHLDRYGWATV